MQPTRHATLQLATSTQMNDDEAKREARVAELARRRIMRRTVHELEAKASAIQRTILNARLELDECRQSLAKKLNDLATCSMPTTLEFATSPNGKNVKTKQFIIPKGLEDVEARRTPSPVKNALAQAWEQRHSRRQPIPTPPEQSRIQGQNQRPEAKHSSIALVATPHAEHGHPTRARVQVSVPGMTNPWLRAPCAASVVQPLQNGTWCEAKEIDSPLSKHEINATARQSISPRFIPQAQMSQLSASLPTHLAAAGTPPNPRRGPHTRQALGMDALRRYETKPNLTGSYTAMEASPSNSQMKAWAGSRPW